MPKNTRTLGTMLVPDILAGFAGSWGMSRVDKAPHKRKQSKRSVGNKKYTGLGFKRPRGKMIPYVTLNSERRIQ